MGAITPGTLYANELPLEPPEAVQRIKDLENTTFSAETGHPNIENTPSAMKAAQSAKVIEVREHAPLSLFAYTLRSNIDAVITVFPGVLLVILSHVFVTFVTKHGGGMFQDKIATYEVRDREGYWGERAG